MSQPSAAYVSAVHQTAVLDNQITRALAELREVNRIHWNAAEMNDLRLHYAAIGRLPDLLAMVQEEIAIVKRHGPRKVSWWDMIDGEG